MEITFAEFLKLWEHSGDRELLLRILHGQTRMEHHMSDISNALNAEDQAITDLSARIDAITGPLQAALNDAVAARDAAVAADVTDKAALDAANADLADALTRVQAEVDKIGGLAQPPAA